MTQLLRIQLYSQVSTQEKWKHIFTKKTCLRMFKGVPNWKQPRSPSTREINCGRNKKEKEKTTDTYNMNESQNTDDEWKKPAQKRRHFMKL